MRFEGSATYVATEDLKLAVARSLAQRILVTAFERFERDVSAAQRDRLDEPRH